MVLRGTVLTALVVAASTAEAQPQQNLQPLVGTAELMKITPSAGFIDDVIAYDTQRLAYVVADTSTKAELHVVQLGCTKCVADKQEIVVDLSAVTLRPQSLRLVGQRVFVIGATEDGNQVAALVELATKKPVYKLGPATHITLVTRDGKPRIAMHQAAATKVGTRHDVELLALETGKRIAKGKALELEKDHQKKLDFRVNHWIDGWTRVVGIKGGEWVKKENQRSPDREAIYDLITGKFVSTKAIGDLFEQRKRYQVLADAGGQNDFLRMKPDNSAIELWRAGSSSTAGASAAIITLDQPLSLYDTKSLQGVVNADGSVWIALKIDPVNAEAVARKKADPEYLDIFRAGPDGKATRKARILAKGVRHRFGVVDNFFWLLERSTSFERGGRALSVYSLQP